MLTDLIDAWTKILLFLLVVFALASMGKHFGLGTKANAANEDAWTQRDVQRLVKAEEDQVRALRDIAAEIRRRR